MAIQNRRGVTEKFDPSKMLPGEFAVTTDDKKVFITFNPGDVKELSTKEDMDDYIDAAVSDGIENAIVSSVTVSPTPPDKGLWLEVI